MKILVITPFGRDANSFWRCVGPMTYLSKHSGGKIQVEFPIPNLAMGWEKIVEYDLIFLHRPCRKDDLTIMQLAHAANIPVWVDYDDWLFDLPDWNPHQAAYHNKNLQLTVAHILAAADVVTTTTDCLMKGLAQVNDNVIICPNSYRSDLFPFRGPTPMDRKIQFVWRGTNTHDGDLDSVKAGFGDLPDKLYVMGDLPYSMKSMLHPSQYETIAHQNVLSYWRLIYDIAPKFMLYPLKDCYFNRCKSNIAWMESIHAGAMTIAPDLPEWRQPGVLNYKPDDPESFKQTIHEATQLTPEQFQSQVSMGFEHMKRKYDISLTNEIRVKICEALTSPLFKKNAKSPFDQGMALWSLSRLKGKENE